MNYKSNLPAPLKGIIPPMVTPLLDNNKLDIAGLERLIEHILRGGVNGLFILGTTGEFASLSYNLRYELIERVCSQVNSRVPVLVGISDTSFNESLKLAEKSAAYGADAVVVAPPYYFAPAQVELLEYLTHLTKRLPLPMFLYNMPSLTKVMISADTVRRASEIPGIIGLKDSSADLIYMSGIQHMLRDNKNFTILMGPEQITAHFVLMGGHGGISGGANMFPQLYVDLYHAAVKKDFKKLIPLQQKVMDISDLIYGLGQYGSSLIKGVKCVLSLMGICSDFPAEPFQRFKKREREKMKEILKSLDLHKYKGNINLK